MPTDFFMFHLFMTAVTQFDVQYKLISSWCASHQKWWKCQW